MAKTAGGDVLDKERAEKVLYSGAGLPGGGQLEIRMEISADHPDPDIRGVARRVKFFNLESWHTQWIQVAEKNEQLAADFEREERKVTAHEFYLRAADFYRRALVYLPETTHVCYRATGNSKRPLTRPGVSFPRPSKECRSPTRAINWMLFSIQHVAHREAVVPLFTTTAEPTSTCAAGCLSSMSMDRDTAGRCERKNYMLRRIPSEWPKRSSIIWSPVRTSIPIESACTAPVWAAIPARAARPRKNGSRQWRFGAVLTSWSMIFLTITHPSKIACDGFWVPRISKKHEIKSKKFTLEGRADRIECPLLVGYSHDDRVMDPRGALKLYQNAVNSPQREMLDGVGHGEKRFDRRTYIADWFMKQLDAG